MRRCSLLFVCLMLSGCFSLQQRPDEWLQLYGLPTPDKSGRLTLCSQVDCAQIQQVSLSSSQQHQLQQLFQPAPQTAEEERRLIAKGIGLLEQQMGPQLNTSGDGPGNSLGMFSGSNQLDCVAETSNTSVYLLFLEQEGLLKFHTTAGRAHRGLFTLHMPHNTATIIEQESGRRFAVDSWYGANGEAAWIIPVEQWLAGARPQ